ncbi:unnamed protein product, partial [Nesidiocoris tenuis]
MKKPHSVIFIDNCDQPKYQRLDRRTSDDSATSLSGNFRVSPRDIPKRILSSFVPPILGENSRKVYVDLIGPLLAVVILSLVLSSGHSDKHPKAMLNTPPILALSYYCLAMPSICLFAAKAGNSTLSLAEILSLLGYGLYGHILTILSCYLISMSDMFFFLAMILFCGLSAFRLAVVLLLTIPRPVARLIVCSLVTICHVLFLVFIHFAYMHKTFVYG